MLQTEYSQNVLCWNLMPKEVLENGLFGRWLGYEGGTVMNGITVLIKETFLVSSFNTDEGI